MNLNINWKGKKVLFILELRPEYTLQIIIQLFQSVRLDYPILIGFCKNHGQGVRNEMGVSIENNLTKQTVKM